MRGGRSFSSQAGALSLACLLLHTCVVLWVAPVVLPGSFIQAEDTAATVQCTAGECIGADACRLRVCARRALYCRMMAFFVVGYQGGPK
jgi:hypothetical protein